MRPLTVSMALGLALLAACATSPEPQPSPTQASPQSLPAEFAAGSDWVLVYPQLPGEVTMRFEAGRLSGSAQVNLYNADVEAGTDGSISLGPIVRTEMAGPPKLMRAEDDYLGLLGRARSWMGDGAQLTFSADDQTLVRYALPDTPAAFGATLVGMRVPAAKSAAREEGYAVRVVSVDGEDRAVTLDFNPQRLNLTVVDGRVTEVVVG